MRRLVQTFRFVRVMLAARTIQDFLLNGPPGASERPEHWEGYVAACQKRLDRVRALDRSHPSWRVEARKRLLQLATVAVALMERIDGDTTGGLDARRCPWCGAGETECRCSGGKFYRQRRRVVDSPSAYDLSDPRHPAQRARR
jgi:hypothetical protein